MTEIISFIITNGIGVVCVAYLIYFQTTTMKDLSKNQEKTNSLLDKITDRLENLEDKIKDWGNNK